MLWTNGARSTGHRVEGMTPESHLTPRANSKAIPGGPQAQTGEVEQMKAQIRNERNSLGSLGGGERFSYTTGKALIIKEKTDRS